MSEIKLIVALKGKLHALSVRIARLQSRAGDGLDIEVEQIVKLCRETSDMLPSDAAMRVMGSVTSEPRMDSSHRKLSERIAELEAQKAQPPCGADGVWRPIETAPLDGRAVLVMSDNWPGTKSGRAETCNGHNTYVAEWWAESNEWMCYMSLPCEPVCPIAPTHWMPLPDVPSSQPAAPVAPAPVAVPAGYRLQPLSEYEAMRHALDMPDGDFPKWKELVIADLQTSYDSDGVTHEDSGDPLIYLQSAIAIVEDMLLPDELLASQPAAPVAPAPVAVPDEVMAALDRMCTPLHESILKGATAASDAASMKVIRDYILATHPQGVRAVPGEYVLVPVNPTREMISAGDAANDGIVSDIYRAMVSQVVKESFTTAVPRVPFSMPDAAVERIYDAARRSFRRFASSVRGQMVTKAGGYEWHVINATLDEVRSMLAASQREGGGT